MEILRIPLASEGEKELEEKEGKDEEAQLLKTTIRNEH